MRNTYNQERAALDPCQSRLVGEVDGGLNADEDVAAEDDAETEHDVLDPPAHRAHGSQERLLQIH
jgi:hypothetical protein